VERALSVLAHVKANKSEEDKTSYTDEYLAETHRKLKELFDRHVNNIRACVEGNNITDFSLEFVQGLINSLDNSVARRVFNDSLTQLKQRLIPHPDPHSFIQDRFRTILETHAEQVDKFFRESFETLECSSNIEFGMLKNKFTEKVPDKSKKQKLLKYEELNIEEIKNKVLTEAYKLFKQSIIN